MLEAEAANDCASSYKDNMLAKRVAKRVPIRINCFHKYFHNEAVTADEEGSPTSSSLVLVSLSSSTA